MGEITPDRKRVELILCGHYEEAGVPPPTLRPDQLARVADELRCKCPKSFSATPMDLAAAAGMSIIQTLWLTATDVCVDRRRVLIMEHADHKICGLRILRGVAIHLLATTHGRHTEADVVLLAAELAAPCELVLRHRRASSDGARGVPTWFLLAWERSWVDPPSSSGVSE